MAYFAVIVKDQRFMIQGNNHEEIRKNISNRFSSDSIQIREIIDSEIKQMLNGWEYIPTKVYQQETIKEARRKIAKMSRRNNFCNFVKKLQNFLIKLS